MTPAAAAAGERVILTCGAATEEGACGRAWAAAWPRWWRRRTDGRRMSRGWPVTC